MELVKRTEAFQKVLGFIVVLFRLATSDDGCADGTVEALRMKPWLAGCAGSWRGHIYNASHLCAPGWKVCSWEDKRMLKTLSWEDSLLMQGCYAINAAQDSGDCGPCANHVEQDDMAGIGSDCPHKSEGGKSCISQGRIDASCCSDSQTDSSCTYKEGITGVLCCKTPDQPPIITVRFPTEEYVSVGQNFTFSCPVVGSPFPSIHWLRDGRFIRQTNRIRFKKDKLIILEVLPQDEARYTCIAANTAGYAREDTKMKIIKEDFPPPRSHIGCMDGSIEGLGHLQDIVACGGSWKGHVKKGKILCGLGWRVCNQDDWPLLKRVSWFDATGINGCYAYNAAINNGECSVCNNVDGNDSMGGIGRHCSRRRKKQTSCLAQGRIDVYDHRKDGRVPSCNYQEGLISGVMCCRIPTNEITERVRCSHPCLNNGRCIGQNRCQCSPGYKGAFCQIPVCDPSCPPGSHCIEPNVCSCMQGTGEKCSLTTNMISAQLSKLEKKCQRHCRNGGQCHQGQCLCPINTKGRFCQKVL